MKDRQQETNEKGDNVLASPEKTNSDLQLNVVRESHDTLLDDDNDWIAGSGDLRLSKLVGYRTPEAVTQRDDAHSTPEPIVVKVPAAEAKILKEANRTREVVTQRDNGHGTPEPVVVKVPATEAKILRVANRNAGTAGVLDSTSLIKPRTTSHNAETSADAPPPSRTLTQSRMEPEVVPGAYAMPPPASASGPATTIDWEAQTSSQGQTVPASMEEGLPVANQVEESRNLQIASGEFRASINEQQKVVPRWRRLLPMVFCCCCLIALVILITVFVTKSGNSSGETTDTPLRESVEPVPNRTQMLDSLPSHTLEALGDPSSPQTYAYEWILIDLEINSYNSTSRLLQRFALATIYYATGGDDWYDNSDWLNHSVHECFWFSQESIHDVSLSNYSINKNPCEIPLSQFNSSSRAVDSAYDDYEHLWLWSNGL